MNKKPSILANWASLILLFGFVLLFHLWFEPTYLVTPPALEEEQQIVLEDLGNKTPMEESETIHIPVLADAVPETPPAGEAGKKPVVQIPPKVPVAKPVTIATRPKPVKIKASPKPIEKQADPFTNGGPQDLDRQYMRQGIDQQNGVTIYKTSSLPPNARDYFIPFENSR